MLKTHRRSLFSLYLAYFTDYFSWGALITFLYSYILHDHSPFSPLLLDPQISLGIAIAAYPIGEVIGSPILGDLSDWIGRKKVLLWGLWGSIASMLLSAAAIWLGNFFFFVLAQLLIGFFAGKQALAQAAIGESQTGTKGQKLAFLSVIGGIAWIIGPFLGAKLLEPSYLEMGGMIWPSLLACTVYAISLILTQLYFADFYVPSSPAMSLSQFLKNIGDIFVLTWKESLFFLFLINLLGWYLLAVSLSDFLVIRFHLTETQLHFFNSYVNLCFTLGGVIGTAWILHRWRAQNVVFWCLLLASMSLFFLFGAEKIVELWTYLAIPALTEAWIYPAYQTALSDHTSTHKQGKLFGLIGASNGACQFISSIILSGISCQFAILLAALLFLSSAAILPLLIRKKARQGFSTARA